MTVTAAQNGAEDLKRAEAVEWEETGCVWTGKGIAKRNLKPKTRDKVVRKLEALVYK